MFIDSPTISMVPVLKCIETLWFRVMMIVVVPVQVVFAVARYREDWNAAGQLSHPHKVLMSPFISMRFLPGICQITEIDNKMGPLTPN
jgi:hypothetical protein